MERLYTDNYVLDYEEYIVYKRKSKIPEASNFFFTYPENDTNDPSYNINRIE